MIIGLDLKVLVVDDFPTMRRIIRNALKEMGLTRIDEAENGQVALAKLQKDGFDLIISDWNMPVMTGLDFLKAVRADPAVAQTPFLMVTAEAQKENIISAAKAGVTNYVIKPFTTATLAEKIQKIFK